MKFSLLEKSIHLECYTIFMRDMYHDSACSKNSIYRIPYQLIGRLQFERCVYHNFVGLLKHGIRWDWSGSARTRSRISAFGTFGSRVPGFYVIAITGIICFLPLAINNSDATSIAISHLIDLLQRIDQLYFMLIFHQTVS